ncbi:excinuclease ABC subunit UvrB [Desulfococcus sp.]|uniref:excinuclease ABC subunit UvrB n=1 Tax=Desulfococcus sp. TaxID=2025834 RepID=UPI0035939C9A
MPLFSLTSDFLPTGDQPDAVEALCRNITDGKPHNVMLGVTGSGKTFTMANVITRLGRPTLVMAPNKTLAAQLFNEFKTLFPQNAVEYFVSYYDYYQPEAYLPVSDTYIAKDSSINEEIDRMRHSATASLLQRRDVIVVASVSCIYALGSPQEYRNQLLLVRDRADMSRDEFLAGLVAIQYERNDFDFHRGTFRVRGDSVEIFPSYQQDTAVRVEFFGDTIDAISEIDPLTGRVLRAAGHMHIYPNSHYVTSQDNLKRAAGLIRRELAGCIESFKADGKLIEAQRIKERTLYDLEMIENMGYCNGIENYSRHMDGRLPGEPPWVLFDYFPEDFLLIIDESHISVPQIRGMYFGDRSRKQTLIDFGFRLPSALDNRPLMFEEFEKKMKQIVYVSATPAEYELAQAGGIVAEQVIRPTGLMDPQIEVRPVTGQVDNLLAEIRSQTAKGDRTLVTTLTKRMSEDLTDYYRELGVRVEYLHSEVDTLERMEILRNLRLGKFDVLIGINLLREGLDLPEVSLVAILDADKEGFLRSERALIQTCGRTARNVDGRVILYADVMTRSIQATLRETARRRSIQAAYNVEHGITPASIKKDIRNILGTVYEMDYVTVPVAAERKALYKAPKDIPKLIKKLKKEMMEAAQSLEFEKAAELRDQLYELERQELELR